MANVVAVEVVRNALLMLLDEIMEQVNGYVLDRGTSMFETLATISAEEASRPVSKQSASLAAQVNHTRFCTPCTPRDASMDRQRQRVSSSGRLSG